MVKPLSIILNSPPNGVYLPDSYISGTLVLQLDHPCNLDHIKVFLRGEANVEWSSVVSTDVNSATERFVNRYILLWNGGNLGQGTHSFPFKFRLPSPGTRLPPSFTSHYGSIHYYIEGKLGTGPSTRDVRVKRFIKVSEIVDLDTDWCRSKGVVDFQKDVWLVGAGTVRCKAEVTHRGYCIGEHVPVKVSVDNESGRSVRVRTSLLKTTVCSAQLGETKSKTNCLCSTLSAPIDKHRAVTLSVTSLVVPCTEISIESSEIIKVQYSIKVTAVIPWSVETARSIPLVIGNVRAKSHPVVPDEDEWSDCEEKTPLI